MAHLIKDPKGETVMGTTTTIDTPTYYIGTTNHQEEIAQLKQRVSELEKELVEGATNTDMD